MNGKYKTKNCYSKGLVSGETGVGEIIGYLVGDRNPDCVENSYCLQSDESVACGNIAEWDSKLEVNEENLTSNYKELLGTDFDEGEDGFPILKWEKKENQ